MADPSITCPDCGRTSHDPDEVTHGWCEACHAYTGAVAELAGDVTSLDLLDRFRFGGRSDYYDRQGHPITMARWSWLLGRDRREEGYRRVAEDTVELYWVSTVWIGLDYAFEGPPLIFETMVFLEGTVEDLGTHRYTTEAEALAGHEAVVAEIRELARQLQDRHTS